MQLRIQSRRNLTLPLLQGVATYGIYGMIYRDIAVNAVYSESLLMIDVNRFSEISNGLVSNIITS